MAVQNAAEKILEIRVNNSEAIKQIAKYRTEINRIKEDEKELKKARDNDKISQEQYNQEIAASELAARQYNESIRLLTKEIENNIKIQKEEEGSLIALRAELSNLTKEYDSLSDAERGAFEGQDLEIKINAITDKLKEGEEATQRFYRSVGGYQEAFSKALEPMKQKLDELTSSYLKMNDAEKKSAEGQELQKKIIATRDELKATTEAGGQYGNELMKLTGLQGGFLGNIVGMTGGLSNVSQAFTAGKTAVAAFGKQLLALLANPIVAILALIATAILGISKAIQSSEDLTNRWSVVLAPLNRLFNVFLNVLQTAVGWILSFVEEGAKMLTWIGGMLEKLPLVGGHFKEINDLEREAIELEKEKIAIQKQTRENEVQNAKDALEVSELRTKAKNKELYDAKDRLKFIQQANALEEEQSKRNVEIAERKLAALQKESEWAQNNKETNDELAKLEVDVYNARKAYFDKTRELQEQENSLINETKAAEKKALDDKKKAAQEAAKITKERADKEREAIRSAEDALFTLVKDSAEKRRQEVNRSANREIEDLKQKLATEKNLTVKAIEAINLQITAIEQKRVQDLDKLSDEELTREIEKEQKRIELMLSAVKSGSDQEYQLKLQQLQKQREMELANTELTEQDKQLIRDKYRFQEDQLIDQHNNDINQKQMDAIKRDFDTRVAQAYGDDVEILNIRLEQKKAELDAIQQLEGESIEAFNLRKLELENEYLDAKQELADKEVEIEQVKFQAIADITGGIAGLFEEIGEKNKAFAKLSKVLALAEISINTGKALAAGIAQAQSVPFPGNIAAIATTVATILANITSAISTVKSAKFAKGGLVTGPGSGTSDSIPAMLSNGESVINANSTSMFAPLLSAINTMGGGVPINIASSNQVIGEDMLARAFAKGAMMIPSPVLSVEEYTTVANRTRYVENIGDV